MKFVFAFTFLLLTQMIPTRSVADESCFSDNYKYDKKLEGCVPKNPYVLYYDPSYGYRLGDLSEKELRNEYAKKLTAWGLSCIPDGVKVGISAVLETIPLVSVFNAFFGEAIHRAGDRPHGSYD